MKFKYTILYVDNVTATIEFYEKAFSLKRRFIHEAGDYGELDTGTTILAFSSTELMTQLGRNPTAAKANSPIFELAFETDDVAAGLQQALSAGAELIQEAKEEPWGQTTSYVADANGYLIEICSPVSN